MAIAFSGAVAANISILQQTNEAFQTAQKRVATGKKIFSAADDAARYRISETQLGRARQLGDVNNNISLALSTFETIDAALKNVISLVNSAQDIARKAQSEGSDGVRGVQINSNRNATTAVAGYAVGATFSITSDNGKNFTYTLSRAGITWGEIADGLNQANIGVVADFVPSATAGQTNLRFRSTDGKDFTFDGSSTQTVIDDLANATFISPTGSTNLANAAAANNLFANAGAAPTASETGFTVGFGGQVVGAKTLTAATAVAANSTLVFVDGTGQTRTLNYTAATTVATVVNDINSLNAGIRAEIFNPGGASTTTVLRLRNTNGGNVEILAGTGDFAATGTTGLVPAAGKVTAYAASLSTNNALRLTYGDQYNSVIANINQIIANVPTTAGRNLIAGSNLSVILDEFTGNQLTVTGVNFTGTGTTNNPLGFTTALGGNTWITDAAIQNSATAANNALTTLRNYQAQFSTFNSYIKSRFDINAQTISDLRTQGNDLVAADVAEESANLTALQTQQQFAVQAFALGSQAQQSLLRLLS